METGKTGKYFKYAIGEVVLVVIGILIALSINNWNENRKLNDKRQELIVSLIEDFQYNKDELKIELKYRNLLLTNMDSFNELIKNDIPLVPVDSLRQLARSFFTGRIFTPNLTAYDEAKSTGSLSLLNNKILLREFTLFIQNDESLKSLNEQGIYSYFNGSSWDLRKTIDLALLSGSTPLTVPLSYKDYKAMANILIAKAALRNSRSISSNIKDRLNDMNEATTNILELLNAMKTE